MKKKILLFITVLLALNSNAQTWNLGANVTATLTESTLTISGTGPMYSFWDNPPFASMYEGRADIETIIIEDGVTSIGDYVFCRFSNLTYVSIPGSVKTIGFNAFYLCTGLTSIVLPEGLEVIVGHAFWGCSGLVSVIFPSTLTQIGVDAFYICHSLISVIIPENVTYIGNGAFKSCSNLTSVVILGDETFIDANAFLSTPWLNNQPNGVIYVGKMLYIYKGEMPENTTIDILDGTIRICDYALSGFTGLVSINIPASLHDFRYFDFQSCPNLTAMNVDIDNPNYSSIDGVLYTKNQETLIFCPRGKSGTLIIPENVTSIAYCAVQSCNNLSSVVISDNVTFIDAYAFNSCINLSSVVISGDETFIDSYAFYNCSTLTSVVISENLSSIGSDAFLSTPWLDNQPDGVIYIGKVLYGYNGEMPANTAIDILDGTVNICPYVLSGFTGLVSINIPASLYDFRYYDFGSCPNLSAMNVDIDNPDYSSIEGVLYTKNQERLIFCPRGKLGTLTIPENVIVIGNGAFQHCSNLSHVVISENVTFIEDGAFMFCSNLSSITNRSIIPQTMSNNIFWSIDDIETDTLYVLNYSLDLYRAADIWKDFGTILPLEGYYAVIFNINGEIAITQTVVDGNKATEPEMPQKDGYIFKGWYNGEILWDFNNAVNNDITLTAHFEEIPNNINNVSENLPTSSIYGYYNMIGQKLPKEPDNGMYIILYNNGKAVKKLK
ncbi:MAG: leucine-rich repeat protein [Prevotellaceae bacterium]|jgi:uncharacterized repeat protein (TIGR02543 family)|nr:leucine-rich repeat protein [Prevotellaceae bacterium]